MNQIIDFILNNEITIMTGLLVLIVLLTLIVIVTDAINKKNNKKSASEIFNEGSIDVIDAFKEELNEEISLEYTTDLSQYDGILNMDNNNISQNTDENMQEIKYVEDDEELEKTKAQLELKTLKEELIKADLEEKQKQVEIIDQEKKTEEIEVIDLGLDIIEEFESDQEENAIISLEEFNKVSDKIYDQNEITQYKDEGNEPISIKELEALYNTKELKVISKDEELIPIVEVKKEETPIIKSEIKEPIENKEFKFKSSPIISPVHGINSDDNITSMALENTANLDKLSEEIRKTNEFLNTLRELRKNLQ